MRKYLIATGLMMGMMMASVANAQTFTTTTNLGLKKPTVGSTNWGATLNDNLDTLDNILSGSTPSFGLIPNATGLDLGSATARWDLFANDLIFYSDTSWQGAFVHTNTANRTYTLLDADMTFVGLTNTQTLTGKTLTSPIFGTQVTLSQTTANYTVTWANPSSARTLTIPDPGGSDSFVFLAATQTLTNKTLGVPRILTTETWEGTTDDAFDVTVSVNDPTANYNYIHGEFTVTKYFGPTVADHTTANSIFFIATRKYTILDIDAVWETAESTGAMDVMPERLQGTEACGSGDDLLTAAIDATGAANTVANGTLTATAALLNLAAGDRLCVTLTATPNEVTNLVVSVRLVPN